MDTNNTFHNNNYILKEQMSFITDWYQRGLINEHEFENAKRRIIYEERYNNDHYNNNNDVNAKSKENKKNTSSSSLSETFSYFPWNDDTKMSNN